MPTKGFHSDWTTIGSHRVLLECRGSYPDDTMRFIAQVAVATIDSNSESARLVSIFYDDKACIYNITIASDDPEDERLEPIVMNVLHGMRNDGNCQPEVVIVKAGDKNSDHYDHMEHLSVGAEVSVDRWRHQDEEYMQKTEPPR